VRLLREDRISASIVLVSIMARDDGTATEEFLTFLSGAMLFRSR
jgi:hypothetical protein